MSVLDTLIFGIRKIFAAGVEQPERPGLNFTGGAVAVADNPGANRTDVTITAITAPSGTGIAHVSSGAFVSPAAGILDADVQAGANIQGTKLLGSPYRVVRFITDAGATIAAGNDVIQVSGLTASRTILLPPSPSIQGTEYEVICSDGSATASNTLLLGGNGNNINGGSFQTVADNTKPYGRMKVRWNGLQWNIAGT